MVIKVSKEQLDIITLSENERYIKELYLLIISRAPSLKEDSGLMQRLKDADKFVKLHRFNDKKVKTDFLITSAYEPYFYEVPAINLWLLEGSESVEYEYIKFEQIKKNLLERSLGGVL